MNVLNLLPYKKIVTYTTLLSNKSKALQFVNICLVRLWKSKDLLDFLQFLFKYRKKLIREKFQFFRLDNRIYSKVNTYTFLLPFPYGINELIETFYEEIYGVFNVSKGVVIDVGAFIGDTAIYFASKGAKVVAFEPLPPIFKIAKVNIQLNKLENAISIRNEAVSDSCGLTMIKYEKSWPSMSSTFFVKGGTNYYEVKSVSLSEIIFELGNVRLLKMNCEGCEHGALSQAFREGALKQVSHIIVEVHYSPSFILNLLLNASFKIVKTAVKRHGKVYLIYASKT
jgi:FkbM family methyltransferase